MQNNLKNKEERIKTNAHRAVIFSSFLLVFIFLISFSSAQGLINPTTTTTFNTYTGNLTNLSELQDTNIPSPSDNQLLQFDSATNKWTAETISEIEDTNETTRFNALTSDDCPNGQLVIGVQNNGTVLCAIDQGQSYSHLTNFTDDILWTSGFNSTFDSRDSDTTYINGTGISLVGTTFSIVLSYFQGLFLQLTGGTLTGNLTITENLTVEGNTRINEYLLLNPDISPAVSQQYQRNGSLFVGGGAFMYGGQTTQSLQYGQGIMVYNFNETAAIIDSSTTGEFNGTTKILCDYSKTFSQSDIDNNHYILFSNNPVYAIKSPIKALQNSNCIELALATDDNIDSFNTSYFKTQPNIMSVMDGGKIDFNIGDIANSNFNINLREAITDYGLKIKSNSYNPQYTPLVIDTDFRNNTAMNSIVVNVFSSTGSDRVTGDMLSMNGDATGFNNSDVGFITMNVIGEGDEFSSIYGIDASASIDPIIRVGAPETLDAAWYDDTTTTVNATSYFTSSSSDLSIFENDNSIIYIGNSANFTKIGISLSQISSATILAEYYYCNNLGAWESLTISTDTTNGFTSAGYINFINPSNRGTCNKEIDGTPFSDSANYTYIAIKRTRNNIVTTPAESLISISGAITSFALGKDYLNLQCVSSPPHTCSESYFGEFYCDSSTVELLWCDGSSWIAFAETTESTNHNALTGLQGGNEGERFHWALSPYTEATEWFNNITATSDGNLTGLNYVGIGTSTPQNKLHVIGDMNFTGLIYGNGSQLTGITEDNSSWNESYANTLYADISVTGDNQSWNESYARTIFYDEESDLTGLLNDNYAPINYGDDWNKTYADTLYADISVTGDNQSWNETYANTLYASINYGDDWNKTYADTLYADISITDTNETTRVNTIVGTDCGAGNYSYGFDSSGNIQCREDEGNTYSHLTNFTDDLGNRGYTHLTNFTDDILWTSGFNSTFDSRDSDTTYTNGTGISLIGNVFSLIGSFFSGSWNDLTDVPSGFADGIDNDTASGLTHLTNFTDDLGNRGYTHLTNFTDDLGHVEDNSSWNQSYANTLYADISVTGDNSSWNESYARTIFYDEESDLTGLLNDNYAPINYGDDWNKTYADTLYADISVTGDNQSWNETYANTLYRADSWNNLTGIPHATPSNGDTTHFSLADEIYDWVISLTYATTSYVDNLFATHTHLTNFTDDLGNRGYTHLTNFTDDILWTSGFNSTFDSRDSDTTYTAGNGLTLTGTQFNVTDDGIGDTQLEYNTGQHLTTTSNPTFNNVTVTNCIVFGNGAELCGV